jgi:hypothetical protein
MGLEACEQATEKQQKELEHNRPTLADDIQKSTFSTACGVFATHNPKIRAIATAIDHVVEQGE